MSTQDVSEGICEILMGVPAASLTPSPVALKPVFFAETFRAKRAILRKAPSDFFCRFFASIFASVCAGCTAAASVPYAVLSFGIQAVGGSGGCPNGVVRRFQASDWWVTCENFAVAAWRRRFLKAPTATVELSSGGFFDTFTTDGY